MDKIPDIPMKKNITEGFHWDFEKYSEEKHQKLSDELNSAKSEYIGAIKSHIEKLNDDIAGGKCYAEIRILCSEFSNYGKHPYNLSLGKSQAYSAFLRLLSIRGYQYDVTYDSNTVKYSGDPDDAYTERFIIVKVKLD